MFWAQYLSCGSTTLSLPSNGKPSRQPGSAGILFLPCAFHNPQRFFFFLPLKFQVMGV